jgi:hypothetical protein
MLASAAPQGVAPVAHTMQPSPAPADKPADFDYTQAPSTAVGVAPLAANSAAPAEHLTGTTEPVFIVRAGGNGDVLLVEQPSRAFLEQLARESAVRLPGGQVPPAVRVAAESVGSLVPSAGPLVRGQSPLPTSLANQPNDLRAR